VKDRLLRDNPPPGPHEGAHAVELGQSYVYNMNQPEVHDVMRRWRRVVDRYDPPGLLLGETWVLELDRLATFYGSGRDELDLCFNFPFVFAPLEAAPLRAVVEEYESVLPAEAWPVWMSSSHDVDRFPTRWCGGDERKVRCALLVLLALRGTTVLYQGDEIGMEEVEVTGEEIRDPVGARRGKHWGRDGRRTPMQWSAEEGAGFTRPGVEPWLPFGPYAERNVAAQRDDPRSVLHLVRDLVVLRRSDEDLRLGAYESLETPPGVWAWRRGERAVVAVNLTDDRATLEGVKGRVAISTGRDRDGETLGDGLELAPWEGVAVT
jgi:alpha-glucosidase